MREGSGNPLYLSSVTSHHPFLALRRMTVHMRLT